MMVTEAQARTMWCPQAASRTIEYFDKDGHSRSVVATSAAGGDASVTCLGAPCMWWRWGSETGPLKAAALTEKEGVDCKPLGYCGLAGRPT